MNILIPHSWLKEYLKTNADPKEIARCLSLCGPSVERITSNRDPIYDIELTSNRVDIASIAGIAREAAAILPQFGLKARLTKDPYVPSQAWKTSKKANLLRGDPKYEVPQASSDGGERRTKDKNLKVIIKNKALCPRFTAVLLENIKINPSPKNIKIRLEQVGLRSLNNVIDISNYLMHELGQPVHVFDFDKILGQKMILRESKKGEKITTLDGKTYSLPGKDIIIEDGSSRLIDLCGIMGGANSAVDRKTKRVLLFIQNYEPSHIRRTSMILAQRTQAAALFEKNIDPELVMPTLIKGIGLLKEQANAKVASKIIDIYPRPYKPKKIKISLSLIEQKLGIKLQLNKVKKILTSLGFKLSNIKCPQHQSVRGRQMSNVKITVPSWRANDISIPEDIIEEVARIYGYHNLPSILPPGRLPKQAADKIFFWEQKTKNLLKGWGLTEVYSYSMQSAKEIENFGLDPKNHLKIKNPLTKDWEYLRLSLIPPLLAVIAKNRAHHKRIKIFELANIYIPQKNDLPIEKPKLVIAFQGNQFYQLKGLVETLLEELSIKPEFRQPMPISSSEERSPSSEVAPPRFNRGPVDSSDGGTKGGKELASVFLKEKSLDIFSRKEPFGIFGQLNPKLVHKFNIADSIFLADLDFEKISQLASDKKTYTPIPKYPPIIEDLTFEFTNPLLYTKVVSLINKTSSLVKKIKLLDQYKNKKTFRLYYQHPSKSLTNKEVGKIRKEIVKILEKEGLKLVGQI